MFSYLFSLQKKTMKKYCQTLNKFLSLKYFLYLKGIMFFFWLIKNKY